MDISSLPVRFMDNMRDLLGEEMTDFLHSLGEETSMRSLRVNTLKITCDEFKKIFPYAMTPAPFADNGFVLADSGVSYGNTPQHITGLFYMQEPSAMLPVSLIRDYIGERVLDLCASPGGKTTQVAELMNGQGVLVANEVVFNRAKILRSNIERMGIRNCMVTCNFPADIARALPAYFDTVIVDSPCSGEGMLRKEPAVLHNWSMANVNSCAARDIEILRSADELLEVGGHLVYSTCTLNRYENECVINEFLKNGRYRVIPAKADIYASGARQGFDGLDGAVRVFPHNAVGEGHFACVLEKLAYETEPDSIKYSSPFVDCRQYDSELQRIWESISAVDYFGDRAMYRDNIYLHAVDFPFVKGLNIVSCGVQIAEIVKGRAEPHHNLVTALRKGEFNNSINYEWEDLAVKQIIAGETVMSAASFRGYGVVTVGGYGLALVKNVDGMLKNHFPKALRLRLK